MDFSKEVNRIFSPLIEKYGLKASENSGVLSLANENIGIKIAQGRFGIDSPAILRPDSNTGFPLDTLVKERGGDPDSFLPDKHAPIPDHDAYQIQKLEGYARMISEFLAEPLAGPSDWFTARIEQEAKDNKLRTFAFAKAPLGHPARKFSDPNWREEAEKFLKEQGDEL